MELKDRILRRLIVFIMVATIAIPFISPEIFAAAKITAEGGDNVAAGEIFTVKVTYGGEDIGRVDGQLIYDTSKLEYLKGGTSEGDTGYVQLKLAGTDGTITFALQFKALDTGKTNLEITTNEIYDFAEISLDPPALTKTIEIVDNGKETAEKNEINASAPDDDTNSENVVEYLDEDDEKDDPNVTLIMLLSAFVILIIVIIICIALKKRR